MEFFLIHLKLNGIKSISNEIQLDFYNKILTGFNPDLYRVKAIYGENGSGKTAIMTAVNIIKKIILNPNYLKQDTTQSFLKEIINKKTKSLFMEFTFAGNTDSRLDEYRYSILIKLNNLGIYEIKEEKLDQITAYTRNKKYRTVYEVSDGQIVSIDLPEDKVDEIVDYTRNVLHDGSLAFRVIERALEGKIIFKSAVALAMFFVSINVYLEEEDRHEIYLINRMLNSFKTNKIDSTYKDIDLFIGKQLSYIDSKGRDIVEKKYYSEYKKKVERISRFLKIFKPDLKNIKIEKRDNGDTYKCELILNYTDYSVNQEFESTGIKKLIRLYDAFVNADEGGISFIDEMDSNINDVYLCKIIEYFANYGKGQLCFTTHNLDPMEVIKNNRNSIDFLSGDNKVVSWKVTGNAAPDRYYRNGMIENLPFNVDAIDFIGIFGE